MIYVRLSEANYNVIKLYSDVMLLLTLYSHEEFPQL